MKSASAVALLFLSLSLSNFATAQALLCEGSACDAAYVSGVRVKTLTSLSALVSVSAADTGRYLALTVTVRNAGDQRFDVLPKTFSVTAITSKKEKKLEYIAASQMEKKAERRVAWANGINAFGAGMAQQQITTQTTSSGTVNAYGSGGASAYGNYSGTTTSTTSVPDYQAQAQAQANIAARRASLQVEEASLEARVLRNSTLSPSESVSGVVYFKRVPKEGKILIHIPVAGTDYEFPFQFEK